MKMFFLAYFSCHLLIIFANSLAPDQDQQNVVPDLDPNRVTTHMAWSHTVMEMDHEIISMVILLLPSSI